MSERKAESKESAIQYSVPLSSNYGMAPEQPLLAPPTMSMPAAALSCCEYMRRNPHPMIYPQDFDCMTDKQMTFLERYRVAQAEHCRLGRSSMAKMLDYNKAFGARLGNMEPESWQTGLEDCGEFFTYRWKELIQHRLGHNDHDRNSVREYNTRFSLPMFLKDLEGLTAMAYCTKYCILSNNRLALYQRTFSKMRENRRPKINLKALTDAIGQLLGGTLTPEQGQELITLFELHQDSKSLTPDEFSYVCALAERFYYKKNLRSLSEQTQQMQAGPLEMADFHRLQMRLVGIELQPGLQQLLMKIIKPESYVHEERALPVVEAKLKHRLFESYISAEK